MLLAFVVFKYISDKKRLSQNCLNKPIARKQTKMRGPEQIPSAVGNTSQELVYIIHCLNN